VRISYRRVFFVSVFKVISGKYTKLTKIFVTVIQADIYAGKKKYKRNYNKISMAAFRHAVIIRYLHE
jgi:predicted transcriptional regulator